MVGWVGRWWCGTHGGGNKATTPRAAQPAAPSCARRFYDSLALREATPADIEESKLVFEKEHKFGVGDKVEARKTTTGKEMSRYGPNYFGGTIVGVEPTPYGGGGVVYGIDYDEFKGKSFKTKERCVL